VLDAMKTLYRKLFELEQWRIGVVDQTLAEVFQRGIRSEQVTWFPCHQYDFVADPFLFSLKGKPYLACEIFNYFSAKGKLRCYDLNGQEYPFFDEVNRVKGHKSYPLVFEHDGEIYLIPETSDLNAVSLYQFDDQKQRFIWQRHLIEGKDFVDTSIVQEDGYWYLFTSSAQDPYTQRLFVSEALTGVFSEHPQSPICCHRLGGRNGGAILRDHHQLYRFGQNGVGGYGKSLLVIKIERLTPTQYQESVVRELTGVSPYADGLHTFAYSGEHMVVDAKKHTYFLSNLFKKIVFKCLERLNIERRYH
jgi:hypothetical protein